MSVKVMGKVWDMAIAPSEKLVLLALADHADHNGDNAYPGNELLAQKTGLSLRQVRRVLDELESRGVVVKVSGGVGRGQVTHYRIITGKEDKASPNRAAAKEDIVTTNSGNGKGDAVSSIEKEKGTFATRKGDMVSVAYKEEPSLTVQEREDAPIPDLIKPEILTLYSKWYPNEGLSIKQQEELSVEMGSNLKAADACLHYCAVQGIKPHRIGTMVNIFKTGDYRQASDLSPPVRNVTRAPDDFGTKEVRR